MKYCALPGTTAQAGLSIGFQTSHQSYVLYSAYLPITMTTVDLRWCQRKQIFLLQVTYKPQKRSIARNAQTSSALFSKVLERSKNLIHVPFEIACLICIQIRRSPLGLTANYFFVCLHWTSNPAVILNVWSPLKNHFFAKSSKSFTVHQTLGLLKE